MISSERKELREQWRTVATDLSILFVAPYALRLPNGASYEFACMLPQFGSTLGMLIDSEHSDAAFEAAVGAGFGITSMAAEQHHVPINASDYIECLHDWGWVGPGAPPGWYSGAA